MRRRNFVTTLLAGVAALPFVGRVAAAETSKPERQPAATITVEKAGNCTCELVHRESYSGNRCKDARIISDQCIEHERMVVNVIHKHQTRIKQFIAK